MMEGAIFPLSAPDDKGLRPVETTLARRGAGSVPSRLRRVRSLAIPALVFVGLAAAAPLFAATLDWDRYQANPGTLTPPLEFHRLVVTTTDSALVAAWFVPPQDSAGAKLAGRRPGVLVVPREGETMEARLGVIAGLARRGFSVLAFDHRGSGASEDFAADPRALVYAEYLTDARSALDILWKRPEVDTTRVAVYGESRGGVLAMAVAGKRPEVRAAVAVSVPYNTKTWFQAQAKEHPDRGTFLPKGWERKNDPDRVTRRFNGAIFFVGGNADLETPIWTAEKLHREYPRPKELWVIDGATHGGERGPERTLGEAYYDRIVAFLNRELTKKPHRGWPDR